MNWLKEYFDILIKKDFCLNYFCTTCGAGQFRTGLIAGAVKEIKDDLEIKIKNSADGFAKEPHWNSLNQNQKKIIFKEICSKLSKFSKIDIDKYTSEKFQNQSPITFIGFMLNETGLKEIFFTETRYSPVHQFTIEELKRIEENERKRREEIENREDHQQMLKRIKEAKKQENYKIKIENNKIRNQERKEYIIYLNHLSMNEIINEIIEFKKFKNFGIKDTDLNIKFDDFKNSFENLDNEKKSKITKIINDKHSRFRNFKVLLKEL